LLASDLSAQQSIVEIQREEQNGTSANTPKKVLLSSLIEKTIYEVSVGWSQFWTYSNGCLGGAFSELIEYCRETGKDELLIRNIAPASKVGPNDTATVLAVQKAIVAFVCDTITKCGMDKPESRLALRQGQFDIRFYLGKQKPTNFLCEEDERSSIGTNYQ
jgi:hypothetical protein